MVNVHPSLLPRWRGAAPLHHTIINDDQQTGVSIVDVAPDRFDVGRILLQESSPLPFRVTLTQLSALLAEQGAKLLMRCLADLPGHRVESWSQSSQGVTRAPKVSQDMARVRWSTVTAHQVDCLQRGLPFALFTYWKGQKVRLGTITDPQTTSRIPFPMLLSQRGVEPQPGLCVFDKRCKVLGVLTSDGWTSFAEVICGRRMTAREFQNGFLSKVPAHERFFTDEGEEQETV